MGKNKLDGVVSVWSNSPYQPTGYGQQAGYLVDRLKRDGAEVAAISNYGLEGNVSSLNTPYGSIPHYPRGADGYSNDVVGMHHKHHKAKFPFKNDLLITLYDVWVLQGRGWDEMPIASWVPLDHLAIPPGVEKWLRRDNVTPIAMAPNGVRLMEAKGIECEYVPHGIDTKVYQPTDNINGIPGREFIGLKDQFVVGMVAANKASGLVHRKAFSENLLAFAIFRQKHPDAVLYLHTDPVGSFGGWDLLTMCKAFGIPSESVIVPPIMDYKYGISQQVLAGLYSTMDVMLAPSYGEGFGVPTVEAQACGVRVIGSNWAATPDLVSDDCWLVEGQPTWDPAQVALWQVPLVPAIVNALEQAFDAERGPSQVCVDFAKQFDVERVWQKYWLPTLNRLLK